MVPKDLDIKGEMLSEIDKVVWYRNGQAQHVSGIGGRCQGRCISRQRYGAYHTVWRCTECERIVVIGTKQELLERSGWREYRVHRPYVAL